MAFSAKWTEINKYLWEDKNNLEKECQFQAFTEESLVFRFITATIDKILREKLTKNISTF